MKKIKMPLLGLYDVYETGIDNIPIRIGVRIESKKAKKFGFPIYNFTSTRDHTFPTLSDLQTFHKLLGEFIQSLEIEGEI